MCWTKRFVPGIYLSGDRGRVVQHWRYKKEKNNACLTGSGHLCTQHFSRDFNKRTWGVVLTHDFAENHAGFRQNQPSMITSFPLFVLADLFGLPPPRHFRDKKWILTKQDQTSELCWNERRSVLGTVCKWLIHDISKSTCLKAIRWSRVATYLPSLVRTNISHKWIGQNRTFVLWEWCSQPFPHLLKALLLRRFFGCYCRNSKLTKRQEQKVRTFENGQMPSEVSCLSVVKNRKKLSTKAGISSLIDAVTLKQLEL